MYISSYSSKQLQTIPTLLSETLMCSALAGVNTVTAHSASHPIFNVMSAISITRRNLSSVTCATAASVSKPTSTAISKSTSTRTFLVSLQHLWLCSLTKLSCWQTGTVDVMFEMIRGLCNPCGNVKSSPSSMYKC